MRRFYVENIDYKSETPTPIVASSEATHHIRNVLRMLIGDEIILFNEKRSVKAKIAAYINDGTELTWLEELEIPSARLPHLHLISALPKQQRLKMMIEKVAELGIDEFTPLNAARSVVIIPPQKIESRLEKWGLIASHAVRQSQQFRATQFNKPKELGRLRADKDALNFVLSTEGNSQELFSALKSCAAPQKQQVNIIIGPEGGFEPHEIKICEKKGFLPVHLDLPILRIETATIAIGAIVKSYWQQREINQT